MPQPADPRNLPPAIKRRNRRLAWILTAITFAVLAWSPWAVHHGWIYPEDTTFAWPHWGK